MLPPYEITFWAAHYIPAEKKVLLSDVLLSDVLLSDVLLSDVLLSDVLLSDVLLSDVSKVIRFNLLSA